MNLRVVKEDITRLKVDAIVNAANKTLLGGGGVDGAIHQAAGPELKEVCRKLNGCMTGEAKITEAFKLPAKYVIHTVGPIYPFHTISENKKLLRSCYINSLNIAKAYKLNSIAFSCISTGVYKYPKKIAAMTAIETCRKWIIDENYDIEIIFCVFDSDNFNIYNDIINASFN